MKRLRTLLARALVGALFLVAFSSSIASADPGGGSAPASVTTTDQAFIPEDPGIGYTLPEDPGIN